MDGRRDDEVVAYKIVWVVFECSKWFTKRLLAVNSREASMDTDRDAVSVWYTFVWQPTFYDQSYNLFVRRRAVNRADIIGTSDTMDQRTGQQYAQRQVIDTIRSADTSLMDAFRQSAKSSEGFGIGFSCGLSRKEAFSEDLFGEVEDTRVAEIGSGIRIPGCGDEVQTGTEAEFTEEVCGQTNQEICRAALSENENSGFREIPTEEKIVERRVESCGQDEHHAMEKDYVRSPESGELSGERSDTDFSDVEELDVNDARSETTFAGSWDSVPCGNVTAIASNFGCCVKASRNEMLGAWALMALKTGGSYRKFCYATNGADETQMCTTECTADTFENRSKSGGIDRQLVSEIQKGQNDEAAGDRVVLQSWEKSWRNGCNRNWVKVSLIIVFLSSQRMSIKGTVLELTEQGNTIRSWWLQCCTVGFMRINSLGGRTLAGFRWKLSKKWREGLHHDFHRLQSCCWRIDCWAGTITGAFWGHQESSHCRITGEIVATAEEELLIHSSIRGRRFSCTGAQVYEESDVDS